MQPDTTDSMQIDRDIDPMGYLQDGERLDDLQRDGLKLIQNPDWFCFGMDAVLLTAFAEVREGDRCIDLCTGNGVIPILLSGRTTGRHFDGLELMEDVAGMAVRSVRYNDIVDRVSIHTGDVKDAASIYGSAVCEVVTCNPPYLEKNGGLLPSDDHKAAARHELYCTLHDVISSAGDLLVPGGRFYMVHRPFRLAGIMHEMVDIGLSPKRLRMVHAHEGEAPNMILIEGVRGGGGGLVCEKPLIIYKNDGEYTEEVKVLYD